MMGAGAIIGSILFLGICAVCFLFIVGMIKGN